MQKIIYMALDERPCNYYFPVEMALTQKGEVNIVEIPTELLGVKKKAANMQGIMQWLEVEAQSADALVISIEMLIYGGLLPSRLHQMSVAEGVERLAVLKRIKEQYPHVKIYVSNLIMRTPQYSSSDEEPMYYGDFGREIFLRSWYIDKKEREEITAEETAELLHFEQYIPKEHIADYEKRRDVNHRITKEVLHYVAKGYIDFMVIPQDDSARFGYTALDQIKVQKILSEKRLKAKVMVYPGADEVGATLLARAYCALKEKTPKIYPIFPSYQSPHIIPLYEDRPIGESMKSHIYAAGAVLAETMEDADIVLGYNTAGKVMQEASVQSNGSDITYATYRNLPVFIEQIASLVNAGKPVAIADSAYANGGDVDLIIGLDDAQVLDKLLSYKGWNTNCNTLGTTLSAAIFALESTEEAVREQNILYHIFDDVLYQAIVRGRVSQEELPELNGSYFDISKNYDKIMSVIEADLLKEYKQLIKSSFKTTVIKELHSYSPWKRMFEIGFNFTVE